MNRRSFIKSVAAATASTFIVPGLILPEEPEKRFWALGGLPEKRYVVIGVAHPLVEASASPYDMMRPQVYMKESNSWSNFDGGSVFIDKQTGVRFWRAYDTQSFVHNCVRIG